MRPLELSVTGLRSYRTTRTIAFPNDWQLAAMVGPTGAGKSSLLEALVYALFGSGTVPGASQPTNLITDDAREMRVVLRFAVGPDEYEIVRTYRRGGANVPPVLRSASRTVTGAREVDDEVARILGLRQDAFCSTVLLPQGQFATLLQAAGTVQKQTLDAFFRLSEVTEVSDRLVTAANALATLRNQVEVVRRQMPADPAADVEQARHRVEHARKVRDAANALAATVAEHERVAEGARTRAANARQRANGLTDGAADLDRLGVRAGALANLTSEIASAEDALNERKREVSETLRDAREAVGRLDAPTVEAIAAHVGALQTRLAEAGNATVQADTAAGAARQAQAAVERVRAEHRGFVEKRDAAIAAYEAAGITRTEAKDRAETLGALAKEAVRCVTAVEEATGHQAAAAKDFDEARDAEDQTQRELAKVRETLPTLEAEATRAAREFVDAEAEQFVAAQRADEVRRLSEVLNERRAARDRCANAAAECRHALATATSNLAKAIQHQADMQERWTQAHASAVHARRADAAAGAGSGCRPGEPCPVCTRELPHDFVPPAASTSAAGLEADEAAAREALDVCREATGRARASVETHTTEEHRALTQLGEAETSLGDAERLHAAAGGTQADLILRAADVARERAASAQRTERAASDRMVEARSSASAIERTLPPLAAARQRGATALDIAKRKYEEAVARSTTARDSFARAGGDAVLTTAETALTETTRTLATRKTDAEAATRSVAQADARLSAADRDATAAVTKTQSAIAQQHRAHEAVVAATASIPAEARGAAGDRVAAQALVADAGQPSVDDSAGATAGDGAAVPATRWIAAIVTDAAHAAKQAAEWVHDRRTQIDEARDRQRGAEDALEQVERATHALNSRRTKEIDEPASALRGTAGRLAGLADLPAPLAASLAELAAWAMTAAATARDRAATKIAEAEAGDADVGHAIASVQAECERAGIAREDLDRSRTEADGEVGAAGEAFRRMTGVADRARVLDAALSKSAARTRLLGLARDLCLGRDSFANHVLVARRQGLIAEAAAILSELSGGRLTFAEDVAATFSVLDTATGSERDPRLLSGGEQFQASLALALGLVEIAARAGSRIDCLFLDEGFGALDPASLDTALDALESAARRGRRIVAVTHVDAVTARADQVLGVSGSDAGSHAVWRGAVLQPIA